jgi:hypothetical protein
MQRKDRKRDFPRCITQTRILAFAKLCHGPAHPIWTLARIPRRLRVIKAFKEGRAILAGFLIKQGRQGRLLDRFHVWFSTSQARTHLNA